MPIYKINEGAGETLYKLMCLHANFWLKRTGYTPVKYKEGQYEQFKKSIVNLLKHNKKGVLKDTSKNNDYDYIETDKRLLDLIDKIDNRAKSYGNKYAAIAKEIFIYFKRKEDPEQVCDKMQSKISSLLNEIEYEDLAEEFKEIKKSLKLEKYDYKEVKQILNKMNNCHYYSIEYMMEDYMYNTIPEDQREEYENFRETLYDYSYIGNLQDKLDEFEFILLDIAKYVKLQNKKVKKK